MTYKLILTNFILDIMAGNRLYKKEILRSIQTSTKSEFEPFMKVGVGVVRYRDFLNSDIHTSLT